MHWAGKQVSKLMLGAFIASSVFFAFGGDSNLYRLWQLNQRKKALQAQIAQSRITKRELQEQVLGLESDRRVIEKFAREYYKMAYPGERIFLIHSRRAGE